LFLKIGFGSLQAHGHPGISVPDGVRWDLVKDFNGLQLDRWMAPTTRSNAYTKWLMALEMSSSSK
jgi:hypothetical protein